MSETSYVPSWKVAARTPDRERIIGITECGGHVFAATESHVYRLATRRKGRFKFVPIAFGPEPVGLARGNLEDAAK